MLAALLITCFSPLVWRGAGVEAFAQSPSWLWAKKIGGTSFSNDLGGSIATDAAGNTYTAGYFGGTVDFDPGTGVCNLTAINSNDNFILKLDPSGNFLWAKKLSTFNYESIHCIVVDASGNVYTTGFFYGTVDFDPGAGVFNLTAAGPNDIYIWKLNASGNFVWAKRMGGTSNDYGHSLALDVSGNVYVAGDFVGTADFDPGVGIFNLTAVSGNDIFISKLDSSGNFIWAKAISGTNSDYCYAITISADIYITGSYTGTTDFDPGPGVFNLTTAGNNNIYICKLDGAGNFVWAKSFGNSAGNHMGFSIAVDPTGSGDVYTKGRFEGTVDFDPGVGVFNLTNLTGGGGFISKLNSSGNFIWAIALGGLSGQGRSIVLDASCNIYASGTFIGTTDFDPGPGTFSLTSAGGGDVYVSKYNSAGNFMWVKTAGGPSHDLSTALAFHPSGRVYLTGAFYSNSITFSPFTLTNASSSVVYSDMFIARLDLPSSPLPIELSAFDVRLNKKGHVDLYWATASEINNDYFTIEKSKDAFYFEFVSIVDGAGNSSELKEYTSMDSNPFAGTSYYRLKQTDFDGRFTYSDIKAVNLENENAFDIALYPNPASGPVTIAFNLSQAVEVTLEVFDVTGRFVTTIAHNHFEEENNEVSWNASGVNPGIYFIRMETETYGAMKKIFVIKNER